MSDFAGKICPFCKTAFKEDDDVVICSECEMPHHKECWVINQGCTTFGCQGSIDNPNHTAQNIGQIPAAAGNYCPGCGTHLDVVKAFCPNCGMALNPNAPGGYGQQNAYQQQQAAYQQAVYHQQQAAYQQAVYQQQLAARQAAYQQAVYQQQQAAYQQAVYQQAVYQQQLAARQAAYQQAVYQQQQAAYQQAVYQQAMYQQQQAAKQTRSEKLNPPSGNDLNKGVQQKTAPIQNPQMKKSDEE